jgi:hypothetical protein
MFENIGRIGCIIFIFLIVVVAFFSQQPYARDYATTSWQKVASWTTSFGKPKTGGEESKGGGAMLKGVTNIFQK